MNEDTTEQFQDAPNNQLRELIREALRDELRDLKQQFAALDEKVDRRLQETRPIWESVRAELAELREEQKLLRADVGDMKTTLRNIERRLRVLSSEWVSVKAEQNDMDERLAKLESQPA
ncbi:MAG: DUF1664 domain-containing protein [Acidobacteriota bacterium]|nr:DUF1664 domain-containing protein [Acidobacteriota bacterium]